MFKIFAVVTLQVTKYVLKQNLAYHDKCETICTIIISLDSFDGINKFP